MRKLAANPVRSPQRKIIISVNTAWNIANFRSGLVRAMLARGHEVVALAPPDSYVPRLEEMGCRFIPLSMDKRGTNPAADLLLFWRYLQNFGRERPAVFLGYTIKPNIYGSLAAQAFGIPVINTVSGLGTAFIDRTWLTRVAQELYRLAFGRSWRVFFQNDDDRRLFLSQGLVAKGKAGLVSGSGVDLDFFKPRARDDTGTSLPFRFLLPGRLVYDKGIREYVEAARIVRRERPGVEVDLLGFLDVENRTAVQRADVEKWVGEGVVRYHGVADDVRPYISAADCVVLPSYREGTPRALLEAAAMGKPVITTDAPGCRDAVDDGLTGFLCRSGSAEDLATKMIAMIDLGAARRQAMGQAGRAKMERDFDEKRVVATYLDTIDAAIAGAN